MLTYEDVSSTLVKAVADAGFTEITCDSAQKESYGHLDHCFLLRGKCPCGVGVSSMKLRINLKETTISLANIHHYVMRAFRAHVEDDIRRGRFNVQAQDTAANA